MGKSLKVAQKEVEIGREYFKNKDYENAFKHFQVAYDNGSIEATYHLGNMYYYGEWVEEDHKKGNEYFLECASNSDTDNDYVIQAMFNIANAYYNGDEVEQNIDIAFDWYLKAANNGHLTSMLNVGIAYFSGNQGLDQDFNNAMTYLLPVAEEGYDIAQHMVGLLYLAGRGVKQDVETAKYWFNEAAKQGNEHAKAVLDDLDGIEKETKEKKHPDASLFKEVKEVSHPNELKDFKCINEYNLQEYMHKDEYDSSLDEYDFYGMKIDEIISIANRGGKEAMYLLGMAYLEGKDIEQDSKKAFMYLSKASVYDHKEALFHLAFCYIEGNGVSKDPVQGLACLARAADLGNRNAIELIKRIEEAE